MEQTLGKFPVLRESVMASYTGQKVDYENRPQFFRAYYGAIENAHSFLCGGDPSLEIWTGTPAHFTDVTLATSGNTMTVSYPSVYACTVCVVSESGELLIKKGLLGSSCSFTMPSGNFYVVVNKHNYYPYITLYNNVMNYAQDKTTNVNTSLLK